MGQYTIPTVIERTPLGERAFDIYSRLLSERIVFLGTEIDDGVANVIMAQLLHLEAASPDLEICLYINSPGGSFSALTAIYDTMQFVKPDIQTVCIGQAASAAAVLLAAGTKGKRMALPNSKILIHQPYTETGRGDLIDLEIQAAEILRIRETMEQMLSRHTGKSEEEVRGDVERDKYLTAQQALEYGIIDNVLSTRAEALASGA